MPIRPEDLPDYRTLEYRNACKLADQRAEGRCERCGVPRGLDIVRICGRRRHANWAESLMFWRLLGYRDAPWIDQYGEELYQAPPQLYDDRGNYARPKKILKVRLTHAHLNQNRKDNSPKNVALLCDACHNRHDGATRTVHAAETRKERKDAERWVVAATLETVLL